MPRKDRNLESYELTAMFEVKNVNGPFLDLICWDHDDKVINHVYGGEMVESAVQAGDVFLFTLVLEMGSWRVTTANQFYDGEEDRHESDSMSDAQALCKMKHLN